MKQLTDKQKQVLNLLIKLRKQKWIYPTIRELSEILKINIHAVDCQLNTLKRKGYINREKYKNIEILKHE